jgi:hypothetical protein
MVTQLVNIEALQVQLLLSTKGMAKKTCSNMSGKRFKEEKVWR